MIGVAAQGALRLDGLTVQRAGRTVLHGVSLDVPAGEVTALLGPNGAGKSTLVLAVGGVLPAVSGAVMLGEGRLTGRRPEQVRAAGVAIVPEGRRLLRGLTVAENLAMATYALGSGAARAGVDHALELFPELRKLLGRPAGLLSGGEQQMVVLGQALATRPSTLVVDELSLGLAPVVVKRLVPVLERVAAAGAGVLLIEQFAHVALALARTAYVLVGGRIAHHEHAARLRADPSLLSSAYLLRDVGVDVDAVADRAAAPRGDGPRSGGDEACA